MRVLLVMQLFGLVLLSVLPAAAQDRDSSSATKRKFRHHAEFISVYDKSKDQTAVVMRWYNVKW